MAFLFILSSGASGYITATNQHEARDRVSYIDGAGWLFECELGARPGNRISGSPSVGAQRHSLPARPPCIRRRLPWRAW